MRVILISLCVLLAVATARIVTTDESQHTPRLGEDKCTWGPGWWCQNITTAIRCKAFEYCSRNQWGANKFDGTNLSSR